MKISTLRIYIIALFALLAYTAQAAPGAGGGYRDTICQYNIATVSDTGTGTWTILAGNPATTVIDTPGRNVTTIKGFTVPGTYAYQWQAGSRRDTIYVVVQTKPNAGPDQSTCATFPGGIVQMAATGTGIWSLITPAPGSAVILSPGSPVTTISGFTAAGTYSFKWTNTVTGCSDTALVAVIAKPNAGPDQNVPCYATATVNLAATPGAGVWTKWPSNPGSSNIANPNSASTTVTQLSTAGAYQFIWTSNGCSDSMFVFAGAVSNDNCSGAQSLGTLPAPAGCNGSTSGTNIGTTVSASGSNICATASAPFPYQNACPISITSPPKDVWYSFVASATTATITVSGATFANPVINIWGGACGSLSGAGCARGSGGTATVVAYQLTIGSTYYIQVSGPDSSQVGTFNISAFASTDCAGCLVTSRITSTPPPVNGTYYPGQTVTFCYTISSWTQTSANWLHGIQVTLGAGWDPSTLVPGAPPASCTTSGTWSWYPTPITSAATGNVFPPGFYYETLAGSTSGVLDANPGNNYGDNDGNNACTWSFCITVTSRSTNCLSGQDLTVNFSTSGDGESGSWNSPACSNDPSVSAYNVGACCPPTLTTTGATCNRNDGTATATPTGTNGPWTFIWSNGVVQHGVTGPSTITGLTVGLYTVTVVDVYNCQSTASDSVRPSARPNGGGIKYVSCPELGDSAVMTAVGSGIWSALPGNPGTSVILHPDSARTAINQFSTPGTYYYQYAIGNCYDTVPVVVTAKPNGGPDQNICNRATAHMAASGTGTWAALSNNPSPTVIANIRDDSTTITGFVNGGVYGFTWTTGFGCSDTVYITVPFFNIALSANSTTICQYSNTQITVTPTPASYGPFAYTWLDSTRVQSPHAQTTGINSLGQTTWFRVQVTDSAGCKLIDSIQINTTSSIGTDVRASGSPLTVCPGDPVVLTVVANPNSCGLATSACTGGSNVTAGTGTGTIGGTGYQYPAPYGNYYKSARHQILIHASELLGQVPSGGQIKSLALNVTQLNAGATLTNLTISLGCVSADSLSDSYLGGLTQVYQAASYTVVSGWNTHTFPTPYNWDGRSNIVVDICFTNTGSAGFNPKNQFTTTPFRSVWCTYSSLNGGVCGVPGIQQNGATPYARYFMRPNVRFNICTTDLNGANLAWTSSTNQDVPVPANQDTTVAHPHATTTYQVALTSSNGCINYDYVTVVVDSSSRLAFNNDTFLCSPGAIQLHAAVTGSAVNPAQVTYTWSASNGTPPPNGTGPGFANPIVNPSGTTVYTVTVTGGGGCTLSDSMRVTLGNGLPVPKLVDSISCAGRNDGRIKIRMNAGIPPYQYVWSSAVAGNVDSAVQLGPGTYIVQVTDAQGCSGRDTTRLIAPDTLTLRLDSVNILCYGGTGSVIATVAGGRPGYTYVWTPSGSGSSLTAQPAGTYSVQVFDNSGCSVTDTAHITQPAQLVSAAATTGLTGAGTRDGTITVTTSGGTPGYTYTSVPSISGLPNATGLDTGIYIITVCDVNNCCVRDTAHISGPPPINVVATITNNDCYGQCNGQISVTASGGVGPYTYDWNTTPVSHSSSISSLCSGSYTVTVHDANNITVANTYPVNSPPALGDKIDSTLISCYGAADGALSDSVYGGNPPYTITWTPGGSNPLSNLGPGTYNVLVTDANGCTLTDQASLGQPSQVVAVLDSVHPTFCYGTADGAAWITVSGGTPPYDITWSGSSSTTTVANDLNAGPHTATITDAHGCSTTVTATITQPAQIAAAISTTAAHCDGSNDGSATVLTTGGTAPYSYSWDNAFGGTTQNNLSSGTHTLVITDWYNCTVSSTFVVDTLYALHLSITSTPTSCFDGNDGTATVTALNGAPIVSYSWSDINNTITNPATNLMSDIYSVSVTDANGCSAETSVLVDEPTQVVAIPYYISPLCKGDFNGKIWFTASGGTGPYRYVYNGLTYQITDTLTGLAAARYLIEVYDSKNCLQNVVVTLDDPTLLAIDTAITQITCANAQDGAISATGVGGTPGYTYSWSPISSASNAITGLAPGTYSVSVTDANGCTVATTATLVAPPPITVTDLTADSVSCVDAKDGHVVINVTGGTPGLNPAYTYALNGGTPQDNPNFYDLSAGTYQVRATDGQGCHLDTFVTIETPLAVTVAVDPLDTTLDLGGSITLGLLVDNPGGQAVTAYAWSPSSGLTCIDCPAPVATPYQRQDYTVVVTYGKNCIATAHTTIRVNHGPDTYIPNAFSPNGDGNNDDFTVYGTGLKTVTMRIFNRWGEKVFDSGDSQWAAWDGTFHGVLQPPAVYTYVVELTYLDGKKKTRDGSLTLIR